MKQDFIVGLDIGSSRIRFAVGQVSHANEHGPVLTLVGAVEHHSQGISKGAVAALEDTVASLSSALELVERQMGLPIEEAVVGIGGPHFSIIAANGVVGVSRTDGEIRSEDVDRVLEATKGAANPANHEILHVISHGFVVDGQTGIKDPLGMHGIRLEASTHLVLGLAGHVRNLTKAVFRAGLDISSLVFGPLASAEVVTNARERELGVCVVNIGSATTSVLVFEEGSLLHAAVLPVGSDHITSDIAIGLRTSLEVAEAIKIHYGNAAPDDVDKRDEVHLSSFGGVDGEDAISARYVAEIVEARVEELLEKVEAELQRADRSGLLPAGVVMTGGGAKIRGIVDVAKRVLRLPASIGAATHLSTPMPELVHDPAFSTAVGLAQWGYEELRRGEAPGGGVMRGLGGNSKKLFSSGQVAAGKASEAIKKIFKSFIP
ncbi:MAG: cell division protein FtsA, cell division protein FtsA [Candidatus Parcubacteria bacterium]|jgi:cell division protein FtsA